MTEDDDYDLHPPTTKRRRESSLTFETQLERALDASPAANDEKRQRRGGNQPS